MNKQDKDWLTSLLSVVHIPSEDIPNIELYIDQITTFMDTRLDKTRRYPDDKIMTKTMVNNYTKNHLLPPSVKKKYSREHIFLLIMIYHLKNMLSISDIQTLLEPLSEIYFPKHKESGLSLKEIYDRTTQKASLREKEIEEEIFYTWQSTRNSYDDFQLNPENAGYLDDFSFIYQLCYDIYVRKQMIEKIIDYHKDTLPESHGKKKKEK